MNWKIGDIAICITPGSRMEGLEVEVISSIEPACRAHIISGPVGDIGQNYIVDPGFPTNFGGVWRALPQNLKRLPPANEITTWDECAFKPQELVESRQAREVL